MKKLFLKICIFCIVFLTIDIFAGIAMQYLYTNSRGGETYRQNHIINEIQDSVLIFGSSRAVHHYNSIQLEDSLKYTVYNCGQGGLGIIHAYIILSKILERHHPKLIIYDLYMPYDYNLEIDNSKYVSYQQPFYGDNASADSVYNAIDKNIRYKMLLNCYRYNSKLFTYLNDYIKYKKDSLKGFSPINGEITPDFPRPEYKPYTKDDFKWTYFEKFVALCKSNHIPLIFAISPYYFEMDETTYQPYFEFAKLYNIPVINHYKDTIFVGHSNLFSDPSHLNAKGAEIYTDIIAMEVDSILN